MFRIGAITDELSPSFETALELAVELGLREVEIHTVDEKMVEQLSLVELRELKQRLLKRQLSVCCISSTVFLRCHLGGTEEPMSWRGSFRSVSGSYADHLSFLEKCLVCAQELEAQFVRIFGFWQDEPLTEAIYQRASERLEKPVQLAHQAGVTLVLENCPHTYFDWGARAVRLMELIDSPALQMLWDPCSGLRSGEQDVLSAYPLIKKYLKHVHAKDICFDPSDKRGHFYVPVGQGMLDWPGILNRLAEDIYQGVICLETHHLAADGTKESAARASYRGLFGIAQKAFAGSD
jgi:sugar phosphate isomerase/epimerase